MTDIMWIKENLFDSECLIVALTSYNADDSKSNSFDFSSLIGSGDFSTILLKDLSNSWYTQGLEGVGSTHEEVIRYLTPIRSRYKRTLFIGDSMGAFGAILLGSRLGADKIIAMSPQTSVNTRTCRIMGDDRFTKYFERLTDVPASIQDVREILRLWPAKSLDVYVSRADPQDVENAISIESMPNVKVQYLDYFDHWMAEEFKRYGALRGMIRNFLLNRETFDIAKFIADERTLYDMAYFKSNSGALLPHAPIYQENLNITPNWHLRERINNNIVKFRTDVFRTYKPSFVTRYFHFNEDIVKINADFINLPVLLPMLEMEFGTNTVLTQAIFREKSVSNLNIRPIQTLIEHSAPPIQSPNIVDGDNLLLQMDFPGDTTPPHVDPNRRGHVMSGPYIDLKAGTYIARVDLDDDFRVKGKLHLDVACNAGRIIALREYTSRDICGPKTLEVPFHLMQDKENIEVRLHAENGASGKIRKVLIQQAQ
ncbi:hypothetical protein [Burkholderia cepacia]|uniref:hypothetical protein n=1 Tax=Burkholderia cepacia TaxID=292 RepID=UPI000F570F67|nr:hypothetical protein [Burkholderia cepacia]MCA8321014.1 hypothetical protein [Burkholderia cepacia]RQT79951.1 hypothetical protein DF045_01255 [Burkholderia cepacia]